MAKVNAAISFGVKLQKPFSLLIKRFCIAVSFHSAPAKDIEQSYSSMLIYVIEATSRFATSRFVDGLNFQSGDTRRAFDRRFRVTYETLNDPNQSDRNEAPDAHGQAALLLVESLMHGLIEREVITHADAVDIIDTAAEVTADAADDPGGPTAYSKKSLGLLNAISASLRWEVQAG